MLRLLGEAAAIAKWGFRLALLASAGLLLHAYGQSSSSTGTGSTYAENVEQALAGLKELARALQ